jgi:hypothetical protein
MDNLVYATDTARVKTPECHGYPAPRLATSGVQLALESVSTLAWNRWLTVESVSSHCPASRGIGVHLGVEYAVRGGEVEEGFTQSLKVVDGQSGDARLLGLRHGADATL